VGWGAATLTGVDVVAETDLPCSPSELFTWVDDLARYPDWLEIVAKAEPLGGAAVATTGDTGPAWAVDLRARLGPLARSKRLRMIRSELVPGERVTFERRELDGRDHSAWLLTAEVGPAAEGSHLRMHLHYSGSLFGPVIERVLRDEIEQSKHRLRALVATA
jgi:hypothetical protein